MNIELRDKFDKSTIMILRCRRTMEAPMIPSLFCYFSVSTFFCHMARQEGFKMFPSPRRKKLIFLYVDKTIKTFASCFGAHFTHSGSFVCDVNSLWRSLVCVYAHNKFPALFQRFFLLHVLTIFTRRRVFDCNQNWLIFMRFHCCRCRCRCFCVWSSSAVDFSLSCRSPRVSQLENNFNYTKVTLPSLAIRLCFYFGLACRGRGAVISWLHCTLSWLSLSLRCD